MFMESNLPFNEMSPDDALLRRKTGDLEDGQVFAKAEKYTQSIFRMHQHQHAIFRSVRHFFKQWFNPRTGAFEGATSYILVGKCELGHTTEQFFRRLGRSLKGFTTGPAQSTMIFPVLAGKQHLSLKVNSTKLTAAVDYLKNNSGSSVREL